MKLKSLKIDKQNHLSVVREVTKFLETEFTIWKFKFGLDPILGLIPGLGDILSSILSFYIVYVAVIHKIPLSKIVRMVFNVLADLIIGSFPIIGDLLDFFIRPNVKNLAILEREIKNLEKVS